MTCKDDKTYPYPVSNVFGNGSLLTVYNGCAYQGITAADFLEGAELGLLGGLVDFEDGTILKVVNGQFVDSGLKYDAELDALIYDGKIIATEIETSTDTLELSQRVNLKAFGVQLSIESPFDDSKVTPLYNKYDETGSLGNFQTSVGPITEFDVQDQFDDVLTAARYTPPPTIATVAGNVIRGKYKFQDAGIHVRIGGTVEKPNGETLIAFGTNADPYTKFVTEAGDTPVIYGGAIGNVPGNKYDIFVETYDPETNEHTPDVPLNMLGTTIDGVFFSFLDVFIQSITEIQLQGGGDVVGLGASAAGDVAVFEDASGKVIKSTGVQLSSLVGALTEVASDSTLDGLGTDASPLGVNLKTQIIDEETVEIYEANDSIDRFFYAGDQDATIKLKSLDSEYNDRCRFQIYNDSGYSITLTESDDTEIQRIRNGFAFEFFYDSGWNSGLVRRMGAQGIEIDVANISQFQLNGFYANKTVVFVHGTTPTVNDLDVTVEPFADFSTGDSLTIIKDSSIGFPFINVDYVRGNGSTDSEVVTGTITAERRPQRWQIISNDANTNIAIVNDVDTPYDTRAMSANAFSAIATVYADNEAVEERLAENGIDRILTIDLNKVTGSGDWILNDKISYDNSTSTTSSTGQGDIYEFLGAGSSSAVHNHTFDDSGVVWIANFQVTSQRDKTVNINTSVGTVGITTYKIPVNMIAKFSYAKDTNKMYSESGYIRPELIDFVPQSTFDSKSGYNRYTSGGGSTHEIQFWENGTIFKLSNSTIKVKLLEGMHDEDGQRHGYVKYINGKGADVNFEWYDRNGNQINNSTVPSVCPKDTVVEIFANYGTDDYAINVSQSKVVTGINNIDSIKAAIETSVTNNTDFATFRTELIALLGNI